MAFATVLTGQIEGLVLLLQHDDPHRPNRALLKLALESQFDAFLEAFRAYRAGGARSRTRAGRNASAGHRTAKRNDRTNRHR